MSRHLNPRPFEEYRKVNISLGLDFKTARTLEPILTLGQDVIPTAL
jgi:hypothetical protein